MLNSVDTPLLKETPQKDDISNINGIVKRNLIEKKNWVHNFVKTWYPQIYSNHQVEHNR